MVAQERRPDAHRHRNASRQLRRARAGAAEPQPWRGTQAREDVAAIDRAPKTPQRSTEPESDASEPLEFDRVVRAAIIQTTFGRSPISVLNAYTDWLGHLSTAPALQASLLARAVEHGACLWRYAALGSHGGGEAAEPCISQRPFDKRFVDPAWASWPFNVFHRGFLLQQDWWEHATTAVPGVAPHNKLELSFLVRQVLDTCAPSNFPATNPVVIRATLQTGGQNLREGGLNLLDDLQRTLTGQPPHGVEAFRPGETVACTEGAVIFRNELIELIQYSPRTASTHPEPVLIVPAWIMKYYILDLSQKNSLVKYLVDAGFTVFMISWRNPQAKHRNLGIDDYLSLGVEAALSIVQSVRAERIHAVGYCLGGTLLALAAASLGQRRDASLKSLTLLAAQTDFADAGELTLFVDESEVAFLEDLMWLNGRLEARQMAGAFNLLRSNDLIWSRLVRDYLLGTRTQATDLSAWSADATHMPYRMHSEYLRRMFLRNDFAAGRYLIHGAPVGLANIDVPMFVVGTEWDHVAPWKSVYKIHLQADVDITFALTTGGHNVGIVNPPEGSTREYRLGTHDHRDPYVSPEAWLQAHRKRQGSWWPAWVEWLRAGSSPAVEPPVQSWFGEGDPEDVAAPGRYVFER